MILYIFVDVHRFIFVTFHLFHFCNFNLWPCLISNLCHITYLTYPNPHNWVTLITIKPNEQYPQIVFQTSTAIITKVTIHSFFVSNINCVKINNTLINEKFNSLLAWSQMRYMHNNFLTQCIENELQYLHKIALCDFTKSPQWFGQNSHIWILQKLTFPSSKVCSTTSSPPNAIPTSSGPNALE